MSTDRSSQYDVAVVGGGPIGLAVGWRAAQRGLGVVVLDAGAPGAGVVAAGMLAPVSEAEHGQDALLALGLASARRYPGWIEELRAASGADPGYRTTGTLLVARDRDDAEQLERALLLRRELGLPVMRLRASEARRLEPALAPHVRLALHAPGDHAVDPRALAAALAAALVAAGGELRREARVTGVLTGAGAVHGVELQDGSRVMAEQVVIAAGAWSGLLDGLPKHARLPVRPVKGQVLRLRDPEGPGLAERVIRLPGSYLVPRGDGRYVLGATVEERGWDDHPTAGAVHELLRDMGEAVPGVLELRLEEVGAGLRPGTPDNAPAIGPGALEGLLWATGHHRNGILLAPVTADLVAGLLTGEALPAEAAPFAPARFAAATPATVGAGR